MLWLTVPLLVVVLSVLVLWSILYILFWRSPEKKWRDRVLHLVARAKRRAYQEQQVRSRLGFEKRQEKDAIRDQAFSSFLASIPVSQLETFSGIGPVTVTKLRSDGYSTLASLQEAAINIYGLGEKRLADIDRAVRALTRQAKSRFDSGACTEAHGVLPRLKAVDSKYEQNEKLCAARLKAAEAVIASLGQSYTLARKLTLLGFWLKDWDSVLPPETLNEKLPDLNSLVDQAEEKAIAILKEKRHQASPTPSPEKHPPVKRGIPLSAIKAPDAGHRVVPVITAIPAEERIDSSLPTPQFPKESARRNAAVPKPVPLAVSLKTATPPANPPPHERQQENREVTKMELAIQFLFAVARADVALAAPSKKVIIEYFHRQYTGDPVLFNRARAYCAHFEKAPLELEKVVRQVEELFAVEEKSALVNLGERVVQASGDESPKAIALLEKMGGNLKIPSHLEKVPTGAPMAFEAPQRALEPCQTASAASKEDYFRALEIDPDLSISGDLVRRQFNRLYEKYGPEKAAALGGEFIEIMDKKRQEVRVAAIALLKELGEELECPSNPQPKGLRENPDLDEVFGA